MSGPTPGVTLTATLDDLFGAQIGTAANPAKLRITLCGYGPQIPRVAGAGVIGRPGPVFIEATGSPLSESLWGNDQILPSGTYYTIAVLDGQGNVVQSGAYQLFNGHTYDLSNLSPLINPGYSYPGPYIKITGAAGAIATGANGWTGPITFDFVLSANVTGLTLTGLLPGQPVQFIVRQPVAGGCSWTWPANVQNPPLVNTAGSSVTTATFVVDDNNTLYPANGWN